MRAARLLMLAACLLPVAAPAQTPQELGAERARIAAERSRVQADFDQASQGCYAKFAVNDCLNEARSRRRAALSDLRRQEIALNDLERRNRSAERLKDLESRESPQKQQQQDESRARSQERQQQREGRAVDKEAKARKSADPGQGKAPKAPREPKPVAVPDTGENLRRHQERLEQAQQHRAKVEQRAAERRKDVKPLPVPP